MKKIILLAFTALMFNTINADIETEVSIAYQTAHENSVKEINAILTHPELQKILPEEEPITQIQKISEGEFMKSKYVLYEIFTKNSSTKALVVYLFRNSYIGPVEPIITFEPIYYPLDQIENLINQNQ